MSKNSSSSIITLVGLVLAIYTLCNVDQIREGFGFGVAQGEIVIDRVVDCGSKRTRTKGEGQTHPEFLWKQGTHDFTNKTTGDNNFFGELAENYDAKYRRGGGGQKERYSHIQGSVGARTGDVIGSQGTYQASLNPRFANVDYGANIKYNMPPPSMQAQPKNPLTFSHMTKENYENDSCAPQGPQYMSGPIAPPNYSAGNFQEVMDNLYSAPGNTRYISEVEVNLPMKDMTSISGDDDGGMQPVVYDRFMIANLKSNLQSRGDFIRGDLAIVPINDGDKGSWWFRPSVHPQVDLNRGALQVMGGMYNENANELAALVNVSTDGVADTIGGVDYSSTFLEQQKRRVQAERSGKKLTATTNIANMIVPHYSVIGDVNVSDFP